MLQPDRVKGHWVERLIPAPALPYAQLMRLERPIGWWLLLLPCWWSLGLAHSTNPLHYIYMLIGAVIMRGAGCVWNDILDEDLDAKVERTRLRPIPSGRVTRKQALVFLSALLIIGLVILLQFTPFAMVTAISSLGFVAIYPLMKRVTYFPQLFLGFAFSWGALMGFAASLNTLPLAAFMLYAGSICWVIGYDTIYAHQDREDDALVNIKSTARLFAGRTKEALTWLYLASCMFILISLLLVSAKPFAYFGLLAFALHLTWQVKTLDINNGDNCLKLFRSNRDAGLILAIAFLFS